MGADSELFKSFDSYFENVGKVLNSISREKPNIIKSIKTIISSLEFGGTVFWCGNGGSAADSQHLAAELVGRFKMNRPPLKSIALTTDTSILTAIANDYAFDQVFSRQVQALGRRNDVLVGISTSGSSENVINAFKIAKELQITTISFTGSIPNALANMSDINVAVPSIETNHIQEFHIMIGQLICGQVEREIFGSGT